MLALCCPVTKAPLRLVSREEALTCLGRLVPRDASLVGVTEQVLIRADNLCAYPFASVPILLEPEMIQSTGRDADLQDQRWAEAYQEMGFYNNSADSPSPEFVDELLAVSLREPFPAPVWLDATYDVAAQWDAFQHMGALSGKLMVQLGGKGVQAIKSLLGGAEEAWLVTPMHEEALFAVELATRVGVHERFGVVVAVAEQMPFDDEVFDVVYCGGSLHHMSTQFAGPEIRRIMRPGGRFAAVEPWGTRLHSFGTNLIGQREGPEVRCRPLNDERMQPFVAAFDSADVRHHGPVLRYLALALNKTMKWKLTVEQARGLFRIDDALPLPTKMGGSVAVLADRAL